MISTIRLIICLCLFQATGFAQQKFAVYYEPFPEQFAECTRAAIEGGYLMASNYTDSAGMEGALLTKFDSAFNISWERILPLTHVSSFSQDSAGNTYLAGNVDSNSYVLKMDSAFNVVWQKKIYFQFSSVPRDISAANDSVIYVLYVTRDFSLWGMSLIISVAKLNSMNGNIQWARSLPSNWSSIPLKIKLSPTGEPLIAYNYAGSVSSTTNYIKFDPFGTAGDVTGYVCSYPYTFAIGGTADFVPHSGSTWIIAGGKGSVDYGMASFLGLTDTTGLLQQQYEYYFYSAVDSNSIAMNKVLVASDRGILTAGSYNNQLALFKTDSLFSPAWCFLIPNISAPVINAIFETPDLGYFITGFTQAGKIFLLKTDSMGSTGCPATSLTVAFTPVSGSPFTNSSLQSTQPVIDSSATSFATLVNVMQMDTICILTSSGNSNESDTRFEMYPNPASDHLTVSCDHIQGSIGIYNMLGNKVYHQTTDNQDIYINLEGFPAGIYSVRISGTGQSPVTKLLVIQ